MVKVDKIPLGSHGKYRGEIFVDGKFADRKIFCGSPLKKECSRTYVGFGANKTAKENTYRAFVFSEMETTSEWSSCLDPVRRF